MQPHAFRRGAQPGWHSELNCVLFLAMMPVLRSSPAGQAHRPAPTCGFVRLILQQSLVRFRYRVIMTYILSLVNL